MATSKTLTPTNVTIQIPDFTEKPDQRVNSNCIDKEADAINALNNNIANLIKHDDVTVTLSDSPYEGYYYGNGSASINNGTVLGATIISITNNSPAFVGFLLSNGGFRVYSPKPSLTVVVRVMYT